MDILGDLDRRTRLETLVLASPVIFLIHDVEEVLTMERFWRENRDRLPLPPPIKDRLEVTTPQMAASVAVIFLLGCLASYPAARSPRPGQRVDFFATVISIRLVNVFWHLFQSLVLRRYTPGMATAPTVTLPFALYILHRLRKEGLVTKRDLLRSMGLGALLHTPLVLGAQATGRSFVRWLHF